ncbi:dehydrin COR410-like [Ananas comosus]|uniref:Dehydrin COR410 n=1 Tax=Ananas comosus TaxID=4615 RepID=A0A199W6H2_ANACO|nr:dehydrin COR410-like [Ananas comosus]OAY84510.1 Dehydrin COR410 [Ananas comosus]
MEEERNQNQSVVSGEEGREVEVKDRGLFDFMGRKEEKEKEKEKIEEVDLVAGMEKVRVDEVEDRKEEEKKKEGFLEKLHRSHSSSSSSSASSDEEEGGEGENKEKKKKKKGLKEKIKEKLGGGDKEEEPKGEGEKETVQVVAQEEFVEAVPAYDDDTAVTVEVVEGTVKLDGAPEGGEKKGFLEKIKEKLPGHKKPCEEAAAPTVETAAECAKESHDTVADANEGSKENKKGFLGKIMEKLPGYNKGGEEKEKETEKTSACN